MLLALFGLLTTNVKKERKRGRISKQKETEIEKKRTSSFFTKIMWGHGVNVLMVLKTHLMLKNKDIRTDNQFLGQLQINHRLLKHRENHLRHFWSIWKHSVVGCPTVLRRDERSQRVFLKRRGVATRTNNPPPPGGGEGAAGLTLVPSSSRPILE